MANSLKLKMVCSTCGSDKVLADAFAHWNVEEQQWELQNTFDKGSYCEGACDGPCRIDEVEIPVLPAEPKKLTFTAWINTYKPVANTNCDRDLFDGYMFETYGKDLLQVTRVRDKEPDKVWTLIDTDGDLSICPGYSHINRTGYFITQNPFYSHEVEVPL